MSFSDLDFDQIRLFYLYHKEIIDYVNSFNDQNVEYGRWYVGITGQENIYDQETGKYVSERIIAHRDEHPDLSHWGQWEVKEEDVVRELESDLINNYGFDGHWGGGEDDTDSPDTIYVFKKND